jgi:hypothetical protein
MMRFSGMLAVPDFFVEKNGQEIFLRFACP